MRSVSRNCRLAAAGLVLLVLAGCGDSSDPNRPATAPVSGVLTRKGDPVADATVTFTAADGSRSAFGKTDETGHFELTTFESGDGAVPGEYVVTVTKIETPAGSQGSGSMEDGTYQPPKPGAPAPAPKNLLPPKYAKPATSGLKATVGPDGETDLPIQLAE